MPESFKYRSFLSYSHRDLAWVDWLHRALERYTVPSRLRHARANRHPLPRHLRPIFRDRDELPSGSSLPQVIDEALAASESMIVVCSPAAADSHWVNDEIRAFQALGRGDRIYCLIVDGEPMSGGARECIPAALRGPEAEEPLAADLRGGRHERHHAKMMLIAGLLDVGLDELLQRDHHRRAQRLFALAAAASSLSIVLVGLTVYALLARSEAEQRQRDAEGLVAFMLGDLREDLHAITRIDLYDKVSRRAMEYFRSLGEDDDGGEALALRAEALRQVGITALDQADLEGAMDAFRQSLDIAATLATRNPSREDWSLALAENHFWVGYVHWQRGEFGRAGEKFLKQLSIVDALATANPADAERLAGSGFAWTNYGRVLELAGRYEDARQAYEKVMEIFQRHLVLVPDDPNSRLEVGFAHNNLGKVKISLGRLDEAGGHFRSDLEMKQEVMDENPQHNLWRRNLAGSHYWLARLQLMRGENADAVRHARAALEILDDLLGLDATRTPSRQRRASVRLLLAAACRMEDEPACATDNLAAAQADLEQLLEASPEHAQWRRVMTASRLEQSWQAALRGEVEKARSLVETLLMPIETGPKAELDVETRKLNALAHLTRGDIAWLQSDLIAADRHWRQSLDILDLRGGAAGDPEMLDLQSNLLDRLGQPAGALQAKHRLERLGFHSRYPEFWNSGARPGI